MALLKEVKHIEFALFHGETRYLFPARVAGLFGQKLALQFDSFTLEQEENFIGATLAREGAWNNWMKHTDEIDHPLAGLKQIAGFSVIGVSRLLAAAKKG